MIRTGGRLGRWDYVALAPSSGELARDLRSRELLPLAESAAELGQGFAGLAAAMVAAIATAALEPGVLAELERRAATWYGEKLGERRRPRRRSCGRSPPRRTTWKRCAGWPSGDGKRRARLFTRFCYTSPRGHRATSISSARPTELARGLPLEPAQTDATAERLLDEAGRLLQRGERATGARTAEWRCCWRSRRWPRVGWPRDAAKTRGERWRSTWRVRPCRCRPRRADSCARTPPPRRGAAGRPAAGHRDSPGPRRRSPRRRRSGGGSVGALHRRGSGPRHSSASCGANSSNARPTRSADWLCGLRSSVWPLCWRRGDIAWRRCARTGGEAGARDHHRHRRGIAGGQAPSRRAMRPVRRAGRAARKSRRRRGGCSALDVHGPTGRCARRSRVRHSRARTRRRAGGDGRHARRPRAPVPRRWRSGSRRPLAGLPAHHGRACRGPGGGHSAGACRLVDSIAGTERWLAWNGCWKRNPPPSSCVRCWAASTQRHAPGSRW